MTTVTVRRALIATAVGATATLALSPAAHAATTDPVTLTFVPPKVNRMSVTIGPVIIGGQVISQGVRVQTPGTELPTMTVTLPGWPAF